MRVGRGIEGDAVGIILGAVDGLRVGIEVVGKETLLGKRVGALVVIIEVGW